MDPNGLGSVGAMEAARFLKKSGLSDVVLSRVWDLSDPGGRGALDKAGFFVALKLVAMAQSGRDVNLSNMQLQDLPPPKMGEYKVAVAVSRPPPPRPGAITPTPVISQLPAVTGDWAVKPAERDKYDRLYESLQPVNGLIPGNKVKGVLMESKLPFDTLGRIWDLADIDKVSVGRPSHVSQVLMCLFTGRRSRQTRVYRRHAPGVQGAGEARHT